jgi:GYF domain 2
MVPEWYYADQGQQCGPVTFIDLQALAAEGRLRPSDLVWKSGWPDWVPASTQEGLFAPAPAPVPKRPAPVVLEPARPEQLAFERALSRAPQRTSSGSGFGVFTLIGVAGLLVVCVGCGVLAALINAGSTGLKAAIKPSPERFWVLPTGQHQFWAVPFNKDDDVTIKVKSDHDSDVDLFVFTDEAKMNALLFSGNVERNVGFCVAFDNSPSKDCYVRFVAPQTGNYYVVVANRNSLDQPRRNRANSGKLTFFPVR